MKVYLDNAASTPLHPQVLEAMLPYLSKSFGNASSVHSFGRTMKAGLELARKKIASLLGANSNEIYFCSSGTEANNMALKLSVENLDVKRIISSKLEHKCVFNTLVYLKETRNIELVYVKTNSLGQADLVDLERILSESSAKTLVSLMHVQNELGSINDLAAIGKLCKRHQALFHSDTVQSMAHLNFNLSELNIDFISASAHKFCGPQGIGFLYKNSSLNIGTWLHGGGHEKNLRSSTENVPGIVGLSMAMERAYVHLEEEKEHILTLKNSLKTHLLELFPEIQFNDQKESIYTILSVSFPADFSSDMLLFQLDLAGVGISGGSACASGAIKASPVLEYLGFPENQTTIRFSFSAFNTLEEINYVKEVFEKIKNHQKKSSIQ